jgi:hypothetical protein
MFTYGCSCSKV